MQNRLIYCPLPLQDTVGTGDTLWQLHLHGVVAVDGAGEGVAVTTDFRHGKEMLVQTLLGIPRTRVVVAAQSELVETLKYKRK